MSFALRILVCAVLVFLSVTDIRTRRLPNRWVAVVAVLYFVDAALTHAPLAAVAAHALTGFVCFALMAGLFALRWMGGGDVKLASAIALWAGVKLVGFVFAVTALAGLLLAVLALMARAWQRHAPTAPGAAARNAMSADRGVPYGVALATGGVAGILLPLLLHG